MVVWRGLTWYNKENVVWFYLDKLGVFWGEVLNNGVNLWYNRRWFSAISNWENMPSHEMFGPEQDSQLMDCDGQ